MNKHLSYLLIALILVMALVIPASAQFGIGTTNPDPSAALDIVSTDQGVLHPRLTTAQRDAISGPAEGLTIYNTTDKCLQVWDGSAWNCAVGGGATTATTTTVPGTTLLTGSDGLYADRHRRTFAYEGQYTALGAYSRGYDVAWIDNNRFVKVWEFFAGNPLQPSQQTVTLNVEIQDVHQRVLQRAEFAGVQGVYASGNRYYWPLVEVLQNGNIVIFGGPFGSAGTADTGYMIVDQALSVVMPWTSFTFAEQTVSPDTVGGGIEDIVVLDNGNFVLVHTHLDVFQPDGTHVRTITRAAFDVESTVAATTFGFAALTPQGTQSSYTQILLRLFDMDGNLLGQQNFEPDTANPYFGFPANYPRIVSSTYRTLSLQLTRSAGDTLYAAVTRGGGDGYYYTGTGEGGDLFDDNAIVTGVRKFTVDSSGNMTEVWETEITRDLALGLSGADQFTLPNNALAAFGDGRLLGVAPAHRMQPILSDHFTASFDQYTPFGATKPLTILELTASGTVTQSRSMLMDSPSGAPYSVDLPLWNREQTKGGFLLLSPDESKLLVVYDVSADNSETAHGILQRTFAEVFDISSGDWQPLWQDAFVDNGEAQPFPAPWYVFDAVNFTSDRDYPWIGTDAIAQARNITTVDISIVNGAGAGDQLACPTCNARIASNYSGNTLTLTNVSTLSNYAEMNLHLDGVTFTPDGAGTRTFRITVNDAQGNSYAQDVAIAVVAP